MQCNTYYQRKLQYYFEIYTYVFYVVPKLQSLWLNYNTRILCYVPVFAVIHKVMKQ
jgi:hypothetical protein